MVKLVDLKAIKTNLNLICIEHSDPAIQIRSKGIQRLNHNGDNISEQERLPISCHRVHTSYIPNV